MRPYTTIADLVADLSDRMQLDSAAVRRAIPRGAFDRYETITAGQLAAIDRAVYEAVTGEPYPADWANEDADRIADEDAAAREATSDADLLAAAIRSSGLSARRFARALLARDERTVRRWLAGDGLPMPVRDWITRWLALSDARRLTITRALNG